MRLKSVKSNRAGRCPICDSPWGEGGEIWAGEGVTGWFCSPQCVVLAAERAESSFTAQTAAQASSMPSEPVYAPNARELAIATAHEENMEANKALCDAIALLAHEVSWLAGKFKFPPQGGTQ